MTLILNPSQEQICSSCAAVLVLQLLHCSSYAMALILQLFCYIYPPEVNLQLSCCSSHASSSHASGSHVSGFRASGSHASDSHASSSCAIEQTTKVYQNYYF